MSSDNQFPKNPEKRHYQRLELELPVEIEVDGEKVSATTENVSCGGMYLPNLNLNLADKQEFTAFINLPDRAEAVRLKAKILRVVQGLSDGPRGVAVEFDGLYDDNRLAIDRYIKWKLLN